MGRTSLASEAVPESRPGYAETADVEVFAQGASTNHLLCRELHHSWLPHTIGAYRDGGFKRTLRCPRCKTLKHMEISNRGLVTSASYEYPEGYLVEGLGRIVGEARGVLRLASITRAVEKLDGNVPTLVRKGEETPKEKAPTEKVAAKKAPAKKAEVNKVPTTKPAKKAVAARGKK